MKEDSSSTGFHLPLISFFITTPFHCRNPPWIVQGCRPLPTPQEHCYELLAGYGNLQRCPSPSPALAFTRGFPLLSFDPSSPLQCSLQAREHIPGPPASGSPWSCAPWIASIEWEPGSSVESPPHNGHRIAAAGRCSSLPTREHK